MEETHNLVSVPARLLTQIASLIHEGGVSIASLLAYKGDRILNIWPLRKRMQKPVCPLVEPGSIPVISLEVDLC